MRCMECPAADERLDCFSNNCDSGLCFSDDALGCTGGGAAWLPPVEEEDAPRAASTWHRMGRVMEFIGVNGTSGRPVQMKVMHPLPKAPLRIMSHEDMDTWS